MYLLKYLNFSKGVLKRYVIYKVLWMRSCISVRCNVVKRHSEFQLFEDKNVHVFRLTTYIRFPFVSAFLC